MPTLRSFRASPPRASASFPSSRHATSRLLLRLLPGLIVLLGGACGGDSPTSVLTAREPATVQVTGLPDGPILIGSRLQLVATPLNEAGAVLSHQSVTWSSSDSTIARVTASGIVTALHAGVATVSAECGDATGSVTLDVRDGGTLGRAGGTLFLLDSTVTLAIPESVLPRTTVLLARPMVGGLLHPRMVAGSAFEIGPEDLLLGRPGRLSIHYDPAKLAAGTEEPALELYMLTDSAWVPAPGSIVHLPDHRVSGTFWKSGSYAVIATPVSRITIGGELAMGALHAGQSGSLTATAYDRNGNVLAGLSFAWTTSNATIARVDDNGVVTAVAPGTATITATADQQSASTTVLVLAAPAPSWNEPIE